MSGWGPNPMYRRKTSSIKTSTETFSHYFDWYYVLAFRERLQFWTGRAGTGSAGSNST